MRGALAIMTADGWRTFPVGEWKHDPTWAEEQGVGSDSIVTQYHYAITAFVNGIISEDAMKRLCSAKVATILDTPSEDTM